MTRGAPSPPTRDPAPAAKKPYNAAALEENEARKRLRLAARVAAWIVGGGALFAAVFTLSFYLAMKMAMRSTEIVVPVSSNPATTPTRASGMVKRMMKGCRNDSNVAAMTR